MGTLFFFAQSIGVAAATYSYSYSYDVPAVNFAYGDPDTSNCGDDVTEFLDAIPVYQSQNSAQAVQAILQGVADLSNFKQFCTQAACPVSSATDFVSFGFQESLAIASWEYDRHSVIEAYGANFAKASFLLNISNVCGDVSGW